MTKMTINEVMGLMDVLNSLQSLRLRARTEKAKAMTAQLDKIVSATYDALNSEEARIFECACCGQTVGWLDVQEDRGGTLCICGSCYEKQLGDDL